MMQVNNDVVFYDFSFDLSVHIHVMYCNFQSKWKPHEDLYFSEHKELHYKRNPVKSCEVRQLQSIVFN